MRYIKRRIFFIFVLVSAFLPVSESAGQDLDSLDKAIDDIMGKQTFQGRQNHKDLYLRDSALLMNFFAEEERYKIINADSSLNYINKALKISLQMHSPEYISIATGKLGEYFLNHERYQEAMRCYLKCLVIEQNRKDEARLAYLYAELGMVYYYMEVFSKSLDYNEKALAIYEELRDTIGTAKTLSQLGMLHSSREFCEKRTKPEKTVDFQKAITYFERSGEYYTQAGDENGVAVSNENIAAVYNKLEKPEVALGYIQKSLDYYRRVDNPQGILGALFTLGRTYYRLKEYNRSIEAFRESEKNALDRNLTGGIQYLYESMAMPYYATEDYKNAYNCYIKYMTIRDSVYNAEKSRQIFELETKYQSKVKENEILRLTSEKHRKNNLIYFLAGVIVLLGSGTYYFTRIARKNRIIAQQDIQIREEKIRELEKERMYLAARSVMEGEEAERTRLASDLHNGLGGLLSGIKINLSSMKENAVISHENVSAFNHAISLLDTSISELRRIAHNLMPETLNHYGLKIALDDFCTQVSPAGTPEIGLQFFGDEIRYTKELELTMYRIIQELVNNALKHSGATQINIQVFSEPKRLYAQVTDNGKGFDYQSIQKERKGKGLESINDRVTAMNGKFEVWSKPGEGTEISVEIEIS